MKSAKIVLCGMVGMMGLTSGYVLRSMIVSEDLEGAARLPKTPIKLAKRTPRTTALPAELNTVLEQPLADWQTADFQRSLIDLCHANDGFARDASLELLIAAWTDRDPESAFKFLSSLETGIDSSIQSRLLIRLVSLWASEDTATALAKAKSLGSEFREEVLTSLATTLRRSAPNLSFTLEMRHRLRSATEDSVTQLWTLAAESGSPDALFELSKESRIPTEVRDALLARVAGHMSEQDPTKALSWAQALETPASRWKAVGAVIGHIAQRDPQGAISELEKLDQWQSQHETMVNVAKALVKENPNKALDWLGTNLAGTSKMQAMSAVITEGMKHHPKETATLAIDWQRKNKISFVDTAEIVHQLAVDDPPAALEWMQTIPGLDGNGQFFGASSIASAWAGRDEREALKVAESIQDPVAKRGFVYGLGERYASQDPQDGLAWIGELAAAEQGVAISGMMSGLARRHAGLAVETLEAINDGTLRDPAIQAISAEWANREPARAAEWADTLAEDEKHLAMPAIASQWAQLDPDSAKSWIDAMAPGAARDHAVSNVSQQLSSMDPAAAFDWAMTVEDSAIRWKHLPSIVAQWASSDRAQALEAVHSNPLIEQDQRQSLQFVADSVRRSQ